MKRMTFTGESSAADLAQTHILGTPGDTEWVKIKSLTVSTRGGNVTRDCNIKIFDGTSLRWKALLRENKTYGNVFNDIGIIKMDGIFRIRTAASLKVVGAHHSGAGASCIVVVSCVYNCYTSTEEKLIK